MTIQLEYLQYTLRGQDYSFGPPKGLVANHAYKARISGIASTMRSKMIGLTFSI